MCTYYAKRGFPMLNNTNYRSLAVKDSRIHLRLANCAYVVRSCDGTGDSNSSFSFQPDFGLVTSSLARRHALEIFTKAATPSLAEVHEPTLRLTHFPRLGYWDLLFLRFPH